MAYDIYKNIAALIERAQNESSRRTARSVVSGNNSLYRSTYRDAAENVKKTADEIRSGTYYNDGGARAIRESYREYAGTAAGHGAAENAAPTGGEMSSYAAAQANRSARAMLNAGEEAVREYALQKEKNLLAADENLLNAGKNLASAVTSNENNVVELAKSEDGIRNTALKELLSLYGIELKKKA